MKKIFLLLMLCSPFLAVSQSRKVWLFHADNYFKKADYHNALINYQSALSDTLGLQSMVIPYEATVTKQKLKNKDTELDSTRKVPIKDYINHQIATCYMRTFDYKEAVSHFEKTSTYASYPEDVFHYGSAQMNVEQYEDAIKTFERYIRSENYSDSLLRTAQLNITGCYYATDKNNEKTKVVVKMADTNVFNKGTAAFAAMYFGDENRLLFTSARDGGVIFDPVLQDPNYLCDLYITEMNSDSTWGAAKNLGRPLNSAQHDASGCVSNKDVVYFTRWNDEDRTEQHIYLARMVNMKFYDAFKLPEPVNMPGYRSINPFVSMSGKTLYFSSNRPGGEGGMDLWKVSLDETGNITGDAINLGRPINSELDEVSPFFHQTSLTLFFSSNGHNSIGGLDIFKCSYDRKNRGWNNPVNMGMPINSSKDDAYIIWDNLMNKGYFSSDRAECDHGHCYDIYEVTNEPITIALEGYSYDDETGEILPNTQLTFKDIDFKFESFDIQTDQNGYYHKVLDKNQEIFLKAQAPSYFADAASVNTKTITETTTLLQDFYLKPIPTDEIELDGIEYDFNSAKLRPSSEEILDELYDFLMLNNNLVVEINSHTDCRGTDSYNKKLADRRAQSCVDYLIGKGIPKSRLVAKGYGESEPNYLKDNSKRPVLDADNKRIYLTEEYINSQEEEVTREEYHQRNRRTSFKVVGEGFDMDSL
ncbi:MAG: OmpA family protein [Crocinitomicaceae bacterium]|nr:OmpA family protein [Crocinitomicaceae bacterium]